MDIFLEQYEHIDEYYYYYFFERSIIFIFNLKSGHI